MKTFHIYILKCADNTYYTGVTSKIELRLKEHQLGRYKNSYTSKRLPVELVYCCEFPDANQAIEKEKQIKKWSRAKKETLINNEYETLPNLAKKRFNPSKKK